MKHRKLLTLALAPSVLFFLLSLVSVALTTHYWILGDYFIPSGVAIPTDYDERTNRFTIDDTMVFFTETDTDATITSGCICLTAAIVSLIAVVELRKPGLDELLATNKRRFWTLAVITTTLIGAITALVSIILHYTSKGNDEYGCSSETLQMAGKFNTNKYCTREVAVCNFLPRFLPNKYKNNASIACAEAVTVKWLQIALILLALLILNLFAVEAWLRRKTRPARIVAAEKQPAHVASSDGFPSSERFPSRDRF